MRLFECKQTGAFDADRARVEVNVAHGNAGQRLNSEALRQQVLRMLVRFENGATQATTSTFDSISWLSPDRV